MKKDFPDSLFSLENTILIVASKHGNSVICQCFYFTNVRWTLSSNFVFPIPILFRHDRSTSLIRGLRLVGTESWNRNVAILGYRSEKRRFFSTKTSSETGKAEQWSLPSLQIRKDEGKCEEKREH